MGEPSIPASLADVTPRWLTAALSTAYDGVEITTATVGTTVPAFATNARLMLGYNDAGHRHRLPPTMVVKGDFGRAAVGAPAAREVRYYADIAAHVPVNQPRCFHARTDPATGRSVLLLEDLLARNARFNIAVTPLSPATVADGLRQLANLHAHWWDSPQLAAVEPYPGTLRPVVLAILSDGGWAAAVARPSGIRIPPPLRDAATVRRITERMWELGAVGPRCLIHGDPHLGNTFVEPDGRIGFLDWQAASCGSWAYDVTRYLVGALTVDDRRAHEPALLDGYLAALAARGVPAPDRRTAWLAYRRHILHGLRWACCPPDTYPESYVDAYLERFTAAAADLDALESLR